MTIQFTMITGLKRQIYTLDGNWRKLLNCLQFCNVCMIYSTKVSQQDLQDYSVTSYTSVCQAGWVRDWMLMNTISCIRSSQDGPSGDCSVVRAPDFWSKGDGSESLHEWQENSFSRVNFLCWLLLQHPFHPCLNAVAHKWSQPFCRKCWWQVTAKHTCILYMWLCMKWHSAWLPGVRRTHWHGSSFVRHQPCQCCKHITSVDIQKLTIEKLATHVESHASTVSPLESRE